MKKCLKDKKSQGLLAWVENYIDLNPADIAGDTHLRQLCMNTAVSHTRLVYSSQIFRRAMSCKNNSILPVKIVKESLWVEANKPVSEKNKDPILICSLFDQPCHANIWHHHMACVNTALAKVRLETVMILEDTAEELLSTMGTLGSMKIAGKFREDINEIANKLEDECEGRLAIARITATSKRWENESEHNYASSTFVGW